MRTNLLAAIIVATAGLLQACTGGAITDANSNALPGINPTQYTVKFQSLATGATYTTSADSNGYFGFDPYAPGSATNNPVRVPEGQYNISVQLAGSYLFTSPYPVQETWNSQGCTDHYTGQTDQFCALYQLQLLPPVGGAAQTPAAPSASGEVTVVQLAGPAEPVTITYTQVGACDGVGSYTTFINDGPVEHDPGLTQEAKLVFTINAINNSGPTPFQFDVTKLYVQQGQRQDFIDPKMAIYTYLLDRKKDTGVTVPPLGSLSYAGTWPQATIVYTNNPTGSIEANATSYTLQYARQSTDPQVILVKANASQTSWTETADCCVHQNGYDLCLDPPAPPGSNIVALSQTPTFN